MPSMVDLDADYLDQLIDSWDLTMQVARKSPNTIAVYRYGLNAYRKWCAEIGEPPTFVKGHLVRFLAACLTDYDLSASTTKTYLKGIKGFVSWAYKEGEIDVSDLHEIEPPALGKKVVRSVPVETHQALLETCEPTSWIGKRDIAILKFLRATGSRASELLGLRLEEVTIRTRRALLHGKGNKERWTAFDPDTALALDRYLRARRSVKGAGKTDRVWLALGGQPLSYSGLDSMLTRRALMAGAGPVNAHMWRHLWARSFVKDGGDRGDLKILGGWESNEMVEHYADGDAADRALEAYDRLYGGFGK